MEKKIDDLNKEELGKLFPIEIVPYNLDWVVLFENEKELLIETLGTSIALRIEHFGSTSIAGLASKPTIDVLLEIPLLTDQLKESIIDKMQSIGYDFIWREDDESPYMMFAKGYFITGIQGQTFHVHMGEHSHPLWDRLYFRDHLRQNPELLNTYEKLKYELAEKYKYDRDSYTNAKTDFIDTITNHAKTVGYNYQ